ncbi:MAG: hypothetical protein JNL38_27765 [Myxococcales bacterium]|jgi:hypothetical protein|nr:hypothetical protein [Myxococcales bacterium]
MNRRHGRNLVRFKSGKIACGVLAFAAAALFTTSASAQAWLKDRRFQEGSGIKAGDLELHPGIAGEVGYDSNWFLRTNKTAPDNVNGAPQLPVRDAGVIRITPSFSIATRGEQRSEGSSDGSAAALPVVVFRGSADATYREFIGAQEIRDQRNLSGQANVRADFLPGRVIGFGVFGGYVRTIRPTVLGNPDESFNRSDLIGGGEVVVTPGGGTLDLRGGYQVQAALFEQTQGVPFSNITHEVAVRNRWKFRPRTALFHYTTLRFVNYLNPERSQNFLNDSAPLRSEFGVTGLVTPRFSVLAAAGYGASFQRNGESAATRQYDSIMGQAEATFYLSANPGASDPGQVGLALSTISLGYVRDFQQSYVGNFYGSDKGYARLTYFFGGKAILNIDGSVGAVQYPDVFIVPSPGATPTKAQDAWTDIRIGSTLFAEYRFTDAFGVNTTLDYSHNVSNTRLPAGGTAATPQFFDMNWQRFQAFLGARYFL